MWGKIFGLAVFLAAAPAVAQVTPPAPQSPTSSDGVDAPGFVRVTSSARGGTGGFVDVPAYGACRYVTVTDPAAAGEAIALQSASNWKNWRSHPWAGDTQTVCCRPSTDTLCQGASGGLVTASVQGTGVNGYGVLGGIGTAVATCNDPPYGTYVDQRNYTCGQAGSGVNADGQWSQSGGDIDTCTANSYVTTGACSTAGVGGWGSLWETVYNSCGQVTGQGYFGPACYTQPPCTSNWQPSYGACSGACGGGAGSQTVTWTDYGSCNGGSYSYQQGCVNNGACMPQLVGGGSCVPFPVGGTDCAGAYGPCYGGPGCGYGCGDTPPQGPGGCFGPSSWSAWGQVTGTSTYPTGCAAGLTIVYTQSNADWNLPNDANPGGITAFQCWTNP